MLPNQKFLSAVLILLATLTPTLNGFAENNTIKEQMGPPTSLGDFNGAIPASGIAVGGGGIESSTSKSFKLTLPSGDIEVVKLLLYWNGELVENKNYYSDTYDAPDKTVTVAIGSTTKSKSGTVVGRIYNAGYNDYMWFNAWTVRADISDMKGSLRSGDNTITVSNLTLPIRIDSDDKKAWFGVGAIAIYRNRTGAQPGKAYIVDGIDHGYNISESLVTATPYRIGKNAAYQRDEYLNIHRYYQPIANLPYQRVAKVGILTTSAEGVWSSGKPNVRRGTSLEVFASGASAAAVAKTASTITDYSNRDALTNRCVGSRACSLGARKDNWGNPVLAMDCRNNMCSAQGPEMDVMMVELPVPPGSNNIAIRPNSKSKGTASDPDPASLFWLAGAVYVGCEGPECFDCAGELMGDHILDDFGGCCLPGEIDKCGRCGGDDSCVDCDGVPYGNHVWDRVGNCCLPSEKDQCGICFGNDSCLDCAGEPYGRHILDKQIPPDCCLPEQIDLCGVCYGDNDCLTPNCIEEAATTLEKRRARKVRKAARVLLDRSVNFSKQAEGCDSRVNYQSLRTKATRAFKNLVAALKEEFLRTHLICEGDTCVMISTRATKTQLRRLVNRLYRTAKNAKLYAIRDCKINSHRSTGLRTEDYRDAALNAVKRLPNSNNSC